MSTQGLVSEPIGLPSWVASEHYGAAADPADATTIFTPPIDAQALASDLRSVTSELHTR